MAATSRSSLAILSIYDSSDDDEPVCSSRVSSKRSLLDTEFQGYEYSSKKQCTNEKKLLPSPLGLDQIFPLTASTPVDNPEQHDGRVRSFPHERGNWSTLVYIHYEPSIVLESFVDVVKVICSTDVGLALKAPDELHISLTRTVVLRHHWIDSFVGSVRQIFEAVARFQLTFGSVDVYTNEEKTRTFVGLVVELGQQALQSCVEELDKCLAEFRLQPFYDDPSFHMTVAWCVGDHKTEIATVLPQLNEVFKQFLHTHPEQWTSTVQQLSCKSGNKKFVFPLAR